MRAVSSAANVIFAGKLLIEKGRDLKIVHIIFTDNFAGSERHCADLANAQDENGDDVYLVLMRQTKKPSISDHLRPGVTILELNWFQRRLGLARTISTISPDIIHAHLGRAARALQNIDCPSVGTLHVKYKAKDHDHLDGIICLNEAQEGRLAHLDCNKAVIGNWVTPYPEPDMAFVNAERARLNISDNAFTFGYMGRLNAPKNVDLLISAFKDMPRNTHLMIVGDGEERRALEALAGDDARITFLGVRSDVGNCYAMMDCLVLPSRNEGFPLVLGEAMRLGCPIISSETEGALSCLPKGAPFFAVGDRQGLIAHMHDELRKGRRRMTYDTRHLKREVQVEKIKSFYNSVIRAS